MAGSKIYVRGVAKTASRQRDFPDIVHDFRDVLIFDTETTTNFQQRLRVGAFLWRGARSPDAKAFGFFHADDLPEADLATLRDYTMTFHIRLPRIIADQKRISASERATDNHLRPVSEQDIDGAFTTLRPYENNPIKLLSRRVFAEFLLGALSNRWPFHSGETSYAAVICLNALFDMGAIAAPKKGETTFPNAPCPVYAWGYEKLSGDKGFAFALCECRERRFECFVDGAHNAIKAFCPKHPNVVSRNLGGRKNDYRLSDNSRHGPIIDLSVLGRALLGPGPTSLRKLGERMGAKILKRKDEAGHGGPLTPEYLDYLVIDILASAELFDLQFIRYAEHGLSTPIASIVSEASIGKAYLKELGVPDNIGERPFLTLDGRRADKRKVYAAAAEMYQGGRSEVTERLVSRDMIYCDFKSEYPTVNALMGLQSLLTAREFRIETGQATIDRAREVLQLASHEWLQRAENWQRLRIMVQIELKGCELSQRWDMGSDKRYSVIHIDEASTAVRWVSLADAIASKLFTRGHEPHVLDAIEVVPVGIVETRELKLFGRNAAQINLARVDLFVRLIDIRTEIKAQIKDLRRQLKAAHGEDAAALTSQITVLSNVENNLKLIANATSYGILVETVMEGRDEIQGRYYAPFIAGHITGGARLLLALAQTLARDIGREKAGFEIAHAMCDTDSMAFIKPAGLERETFEAIISEVTRYFRMLSPYENDKNLFARETDYDPETAGGGNEGGVWFFGVSRKRYCIFNRVREGGRERIVFKKISSHGLGGYRFDRGMTCDGVSAPLDDTAEMFGANPADESDEGVGEEFGALASAAGDAKWTSWQAYMWTRAIERDLKLRPLQSRERELHASFPVEAWGLNPTRQPRGVTTPSILRQHAALGVRPGSFFATMPEKDGLIVCMPGLADNARDAMASECRDKKTGRLLTREEINQAVTPLAEKLKHYFVNPERAYRAADGREGLKQPPGRLGLWTRTIDADGVITRDRKGRVVSEADLFAEVENKPRRVKDRQPQPSHK